ncbi:MAG: hypothetical protein K8T10_21825 [Candidatus Eremiobacteraeota bacterium]|nr:hypothetical protein [Candidatus Eremiobacteraeota bacterium]
MNRKLVVIVFIGLFLIMASIAGWADTDVKDLKLISTFEGGKLYKADKVNVLELHGNYRQMGRQYGKLMKNQLNGLYDTAINNYFIKKKGLSNELIKEASRHLFSMYPRRFKEIYYGMSETSGMDLEKLIILDQLFIYVLFSSSSAECSGIAAWGEYTSGKPLVFGRNFDYPACYREFAKFFTIVVYNPDDGSIPTANIGYAGQIIVLTGMNKASIFIENNDGTISGGSIFYDNRIPFYILELGFLLDFSSLSQLNAALHSTRSDFTYIVNVADKNEAYSYEMATFGVKRRAGVKKGLLVATNHFVDPSWGISEPFNDKPHLTMLRRKNLLAQAEKYKGKFNAKKMMDILDIPIDKGGVTRPKHTIYQIVAVPEKLRFWLKLPGYQDWVRIDLDPLFK